MNKNKAYKAITANDMDKILMSAVKTVAKKDINKVKKVYLDYIKRKFEDINEDFPLEVGGDFIAELQEKYEDSEVDFDFDMLLDKMMDKTVDVLEKTFKTLKEEIMKL